MESPSGPHNRQRHRDAARAGEPSALGLITPANLRSAASKNAGAKSYARGQSDLGELARDGIATMTPLPNSGTAPRAAIRAVATGLPAAMAAVAGNDLAGPGGALAGFGAASLLPRAVGAGMMSQPGQAYLRNQRLMPSGQPASFISLPAGALAHMTLGDDELKQAVFR